jgi:hypothetical protein
MNDSGKRYIGLDVHKHYLIALGVDVELNVVLPARRVELSRLETWMKKTLTKQDEVVLETPALPGTDQPGRCACRCKCDHEHLAAV